VHSSRQDATPPRIQRQRGTALARSENLEGAEAASVAPGRPLHTAQLLTSGWSHWGDFADFQTLYNFILVLAGGDAAGF